MSSASSRVNWAYWPFRIKASIVKLVSSPVLYLFGQQRNSLRNRKLLQYHDAGSATVDFFDPSADLCRIAAITHFFAYVWQPQTSRLKIP